MGLINEGITEVIAVTHNNAAPIGIILKHSQSPKMVLFKGSKTSENVKKYGWVTANFVSDSYLYPYYAFNDAQEDEMRSAVFSGVEMQVLRDADAFVAFEAEILNETESAYFAELTPVASEYLRSDLRPVNRGFNSVIDASVHATRYVMNKDAHLLELIKYHIDIVRKCGGKRDIEAADLICRVCGFE